MAILEDRFGRSFPYLRLSVIEACNFRCTYCLPDGFQARAGRPQPLTREEIARLLRGFAGVGLRKLRLPRAELDKRVGEALEMIKRGLQGILSTEPTAGWRAGARPG